MRWRETGERVSNESFTRVVAYVSTRVDKDVLIGGERRHAGNLVPRYEMVTARFRPGQNSTRCAAAATIGCEVESSIGHSAGINNNRSTFSGARVRLGSISKASFNYSVASFPLRE